MRSGPVAKNVDAYIKAAPPSVQPKLKELRKLVKALAPGSAEGISYGMPYYKYLGRALLGFAAFRHHIGFFPGAIIKDFQEELSGYKTAKGTVQFPFDKPLPATLIKKLIRAGLKRNEAKMPAKTL